MPESKPRSRSQNEEPEENGVAESAAQTSESAEETAEKAKATAEQAAAEQTDAPEQTDAGDPIVQYTPQQAIDSSRELAGGEPSWLVQEALTKAELIDAEFLTTDQINTAITDFKATPVPAAPMPGAGS